MKFLHPIAVGDEVSCFCFERMKGPPRSGSDRDLDPLPRRQEPRTVTTGVFTYVATREDGKPRALGANPDAGGRGEVIGGPPLFRPDGTAAFPAG
jgi:hypothetical protein